KVDTSVRKGEIALDVALDKVADDASYSLQATITADQKPVVGFSSQPFRTADLRTGRYSFAETWRPDRFWDIHPPQNHCEISLSLHDAAGKVLDTSYATRFGFREFWIDGRDFYLNGSRIFLSAVPLDNAQVGAALASYAGAKESLLRLKAIGINFVYTHNY